MPSSNPSDPLFWPALFETIRLVVIVLALAWVIRLLVKREPGHHPQHVGDQGVNTYDASSRSTTTFNVRDVNIGNPRGPGSPE